jgi:hypothetical protein
MRYGTRTATAAIVMALVAAAPLTAGAVLSPNVNKVDSLAIPFI